MTRWLALLALVLAVGLIVGQPPAKMQRAADSQPLTVTLDNEPYLPDQVVVQLYPNYDIATVAAMHGLDPVPITQLTVGDPAEELVTSYLMRIADGMTPEQKSAQLTADTLRVFIGEPNFKYAAPEAARPSWSVGDSFLAVAAGRKSYNGQWSRNVIRLNEAHQITQGMSSQGPVIVAVLDTGIDLNHPAFAGRLVPGHDFVDGDNDPSEEGDPQMGPYGHGTHVAGLIAMVAPEAKIMPLRVLGADGRGNAFSLATAIKYAVDNGADVINLSLSTTSPMEVVQDVFYHELSDKDDVPPGTMSGAVAVVAAGNSGTTTMEYPAGVVTTGRPGREVLAVAASDYNDQLTVFSTRGSWVTVMAPGIRMISSVPHSRYGNWAGTSMAAPLVAGEVALVRAVYPGADPKDIRNHIRDMAVSITGQRPRIDIMRALTTPPDDRMLPKSMKR